MSVAPENADLICFKALHEALCDNNIKHPAKRKTWRCDEDFNWLDAASFDFLVEMTVPILLFCARKMASFETTPEFIRSVLPPPLEPTENSVGSVLIATWARGNAIGNFRGGAVYVQAKYQDVVADYCLTMPMDTDTAILFGRETMGEPKKQAETTIAHIGKRIVGTISRHGHVMMRLTLDPVELADPAAIAESAAFHFKYTYATDGTGLDHDPKLAHVQFENKTNDLTACKAELEFMKSDYDVFGEIPVVKVLGGFYTPNVGLYGRSRYLCTTDKDAFLPYAFCKIDPYDRYASRPNYPCSK